MNGGTLAAAQSRGRAVQATQIPGVAQRTGATTYYIEVMPAGAPSSTVLALNPAIGEVDVALATELLEAGRMIFNGFVTPDRTTLIASTHRVLAIGDTPHTDLAGAQAAGLDALWALTGLAAHAHGDNPAPEHLAAVAHEEGVRPIAAVRSLRW